MTAAKYILATLWLAVFIAAGVYVDCRANGSTPEFCRQMVFSPLGAKLSEAIPHFK